MKIAITGHRPEDITELEKDVRAKFKQTFEEAKPEAVITGMAAGVDLWAGDEARLLGIPIIAARPWAGHTPREQDAELYAALCDAAHEVVEVDDSDSYPGPWVYHKRNEWMVDNSTHVLAYWSGKEKGGTFACIKYARKVKKPVRNIYDLPPF